MYSQQKNNEKTIKELIQNVVSSIVAIITFIVLKYLPTEVSEPVTAAISATVWILAKTLLARFLNRIKHLE